MAIYLVYLIIYISHLVIQSLKICFIVKVENSDANDKIVLCVIYICLCPSAYIPT